MICQETLFSKCGEVQELETWAEGGLSSVFCTFVSALLHAVQGRVHEQGLSGLTDTDLCMSYIWLRAPDTFRSMLKVLEVQKSEIE